MESGATIIGLGFIFAMLSPFIVYWIVQKVKAGKFAQHFFQSSGKHNLSLSQNEIWRKNHAIGIDVNEKKIFYFNEGKKPEQEIVIDLAEVAKCRVSNDMKPVTTDFGTKDFKDILGLSFSFRDTKKAEITLEFYDGGELMSHPDGEHVIAEKWLEIINPYIKKEKK
jgi:hypothetical protein